MIKVNIHQAKNNLSHYIDLAVEGKNVIVCKRNVPIVKIEPLNKKNDRVIGKYKGRLWMSDDFDKPLEDLEANIYK